MPSTDPEADVGAELTADAPPKVLEWHRVDGAVLGPLALGAGILFLGPAFAAVAFVAFKGMAVMRFAFIVIAGLCVLVGPTLAFLKLASGLREDASIAARVDGVIFERNGKAAFLAWEGIERVEFEEPTTLRIVRSAGDEPFVLHERFATIRASELAKRLEELRRKAAFGLLGTKKKSA
jgi:hypothetical protein